MFLIYQLMISFYDNKDMLEDINALLNSNGMEQIHNKFIKARLNHPSIIRQSGAFILFGNNQDMRIRDAKAIHINRNFIGKIRKDLKALNISNISLFPELPNFANELKNGMII